MALVNLEELLGLMGEDKGFEIKCLNCGSTNCEMQEEGEYNYEEEWHYWRTKLVCNNCGQQ